MKNRAFFAVILILAVAVSLTACGKTQNTPAETPEPVSVVNPAPAGDSTGSGSSYTSAPSPVPEGELPDNAEKTDSNQYKKIAEGFVGAEVQALFDAIGEPIDADYAPGCLDPNGLDGELFYDGFTVYTFTDENGVEIIIAVL